MVRDNKYTGVWPVMLTPFDDKREIDWDSLARLIDWYIAAGVHGLFAACQSSEMFFLSDAETVKLVRFVVRHTNGRVPVVASGHTAAGLSQQVDQVGAVAECGVDGVILISNRLAMPGESDQVMLANLAELTRQVSGRLGFYECPYPYKRLLSDDVVRWCAASGRFIFLKDTCCSIDTIRRRVALVKDSPMHIANANSQTLLDSLKVGGSGFSGVMANFHPELYVWLCENWQAQPAKAERLANFLSLAALVENLEYPVCAKDYQKRIGTFATANCRVRESATFYSAFMPRAIDQMIAVGEEVKTLLQI